MRASILSICSLILGISVKKSVIALILIAVLIIIVSPGIIGKMAEDSVSDKLNRVADESDELVVTTDGFDRGWFSSEGQHRVEIGEGSIRAAMATAASGMMDDGFPVLLINTHIDHGLIPLSSMSRAEGSLSPGLGSAVSTLSFETASGELIDLPGTIYSDLGLGGDLNSRYALEAGSYTNADGEVTWQPSTIAVGVNKNKGEVEFDGNIGPTTFGGDGTLVSIDSLTFDGVQVSTPYGYNVGDIDLNIGPMSISSGGTDTNILKGVSLKASTSVDDGVVTSTMRLELDEQELSGFGAISVIADMDMDNVDAVALGAVSKRLEGLSSAQNPTMVMMGAQEELKDLMAAGINVDIEQFDVTLPMGTVASRMSFEVPESDRATFVWTSLLLGLVAEVYISVPEGLVQLATSMDPQAGALIGMGYLKKEGDAYVMDAQMKKGLLTVNGAPIPIPMSAFQ
jgi:uncharacterized protein YdgA (DUF945 family)